MFIVPAFCSMAIDEGLFVFHKVALEQDPAPRFGPFVNGNPPIRRIPLAPVESTLSVLIPAITVTWRPILTYLAPTMSIVSVVNEPVAGTYTGVQSPSS
jgi:hypothetical protein